MYTWAGEFREVGREAAFKGDSVEYYRRINYIVAIPVILASLVFITNDVKDGVIDWRLAGPRVLLVAATLALCWLTARADHWRVIFGCTFLVTAGVMMTVAWVNSQRPPDFLLHLGVDVIVILAVYIALPTFLSQCVFSIGYTLVLLWIHFTMKTPAYEIANTTVPASLVLANLTGMGLSQLYQRTRRQLFYKAEMERRMRVDLETAQSEVRALSELIPMCAGCKKVRNDSGYWEQVEMYMQATGSRVSHGLCPTCMEAALAESQQHH